MSQLNPNYQFHKFLLEYAEQNPEARNLVNAIGAGFSTLLEALHNITPNPLLESNLSSDGFGYTVNKNPQPRRMNNTPRTQGYTGHIPTVQQTSASPAAGASQQAGASQVSNRAQKTKEMHDRIVNELYPKHEKWAKFNGKPVMTLAEFARDYIKRNNEYRMQKWRDMGSPAGYMPRERKLEDIFPELSSGASNQATMNDGRFKIGDTVIVREGPNKNMGGVITAYSGCICTITGKDGISFDEKDTNLSASTRKEIAAIGASAGACSNCPYQPGDEVKVLEGVYKDFRGTVIEGDDKTVKIEIELYGKLTDIALGVSQVMPAPPPPAPVNDEPDIPNGRSVRILKGKFAEFDGIVEEEHNNMATVAVYCMGKWERTVVPVTWLKDNAEPN